MVVIAVGVREDKIEFLIHQKLLNSVTDIFVEKPATLNNRSELDLDIKVFQSFLAWLYNGNRGQQLKAQVHKTKALLSLYALSISLKCESLKSDSLYALLYHGNVYTSEPYVSREQRRLCSASAQGCLGLAHRIHTSNYCRNHQLLTRGPKRPSSPR
jgi:hypothetical protein